MASVELQSPNRWVVCLGSRTAPNTEVSVELRMSKDLADSLTHVETSRLEALNPGRSDLPAQDVGSAVLGILSSVAALQLVKERNSSLDQRELMDRIDSEVDAVRASRT